MRWPVRGRTRTRRRRGQGEPFGATARAAAHKREREEQGTEKQSRGGPGRGGRALHTEATHGAPAHRTQAPGPNRTVRAGPPDRAAPGHPPGPSRTSRARGAGPPGQAERAGPGRPEPADLSRRAKPDLSRRAGPDPAQPSRLCAPSRTRSGATQAEPGRTEPDRTGPSRDEPDPAQSAGPRRAEQAGSQPRPGHPARVGPGQAQAGTGPGRAHPPEPSRTGRGSARPGPGRPFGNRPRPAGLGTGRSGLDRERRGPVARGAGGGRRRLADCPGSALSVRPDHRSSLRRPHASSGAGGPGRRTCGATDEDRTAGPASAKRPPQPPPGRKRRIRRGRQRARPAMRLRGWMSGRAQRIGTHALGRRVTPHRWTRSGAPVATAGGGARRRGPARHGVLPMRDGRHKCKRVFRHISPDQRPGDGGYTSWHAAPPHPPPAITIRTTSPLRA